MKDFIVYTGRGTKCIHFPTSMEEISAEMLQKVTSHVKVSAHHSLIAIVYRESIANIALSFKQKKQSITTGVVPIFIKAGETDSDYIKSLNVKDILVIPTSMLSIANHINVPGNSLSVDKFITMITNDVTVGKRAIPEKEKVCFVDFKVVGNADIVAAYSGNAESDCYMDDVVDDNNGGGVLD